MYNSPLFFKVYCNQQHLIMFICSKPDIYTILFECGNCRTKSEGELTGNGFEPRDV